jgi:hypothetical protein
MGHARGKLGRASDMSLDQLRTRIKYYLREQGLYADKVQTIEFQGVHK